MSVPLVVVGASLGGLEALRQILRPLPADLPAAIAIVQHRRADGDSRLAKLLASGCALPVTEGQDKARLEAGHVYLAPADYHLLIEDGSLALSTDELVGHARPSIDVLFESAADAEQRLLVGILLTAASHDGARGMEAIRRAGGVTIVQDPEEAESPVAPRAALARTPVDHVLRLAEIPPLLMEILEPASKTRSGPTGTGSP